MKQYIFPPVPCSAMGEVFHPIKQAWGMENNSTAS